MIKIFTGWSNPGGSTVAHINLVNLFNEKGVNAKLYGPHAWAIGKCEFDYLDHMTIDPTDVLIGHFIPMLKESPKCKKLVYSCHETNLSPLTDADPNVFGLVHFVSESQKKWHNYKGKSVVIPNVLPNLTVSKTKNTKIAGVIGSIDKHKQTHVSIERAYEDGYRTVALYGNITDIEYFNEKVRYWVEEGVAKIIGHTDDKQKMYDSVNEVYHSSLRETFNFVKAECELTGTKYNGLPSANSGAEYWSRDKIFFKWLEVLE